MIKPNDNRKAKPSPRPDNQSVDALATKALSLVAERTCKPAFQIDDAATTQLYNAAASVGDETVEDIIGKMLRAGIAAEDIADVYIPLVACRMGEEWVSDDMNFASVTIGTARLQASLRSLATHWEMPEEDDIGASASAVIVIVAHNSFHTLGAVVLSGQLRRLGLNVRLLIGATGDEMRRIFANGHYDAVLISASASERLETLAEIVNTVRQSASVVSPIVIGGNILDQGTDVRALIGADYATKDPFKALEHCGLKTTHHPTRTPPAEHRS